MTDLCAALKLQVRLPAGAFVLDHPEYGLLDKSTLGGDQEDQGTFILNQSRLDADFLALPGDDPNSEWVDLIQFVQSVSIERGATATTIGSETEVGLATFVFIGPELDPNQNKLVGPGSPVRLLTAAGTTVFTGTIRAVQSVEDRDGLIRVTITAHDLIGKLANIQRYGADAMTFIERVDFLFLKHGIPYNRVGGSIDLAQTDYESNLVNHLQLAVNSEMGEWWVDKENRVQVRGSGGKETPYSSATFRDNLFWNPGLRNSKEYWGFYEGIAYSGSTTQSWLAAGGQDGTRGAYRVDYPFTAASGTTYFVQNDVPVNPGSTYTVSAYLKYNRVMPLNVQILWDADGTATAGIISTATSTSVNAVAGQYVRVSFTATAPAGAHYAHVRFGTAGAGTNVVTAGDSLYLSDAMMETTSTLGSWFDGDFPDSLSETSHVIYDWYGRQFNSGSYKVTGVLKAGLIRFSNNHSEDPDHACYVDLIRGYDSTAIVNELQIDNRQWDAVQGKGVTVSTTYTDETSRVTWGASSASLEMNIDPSWSGTADNYAATILTYKSKPRNQITGLVWNVTEDIERAAAMEPYSFVFVEFENTHYVQTDLYKVLGMKHDISGDQWITTLTLDQVRVE